MLVKALQRGAWYVDLMYLHTREGGFSSPRPGGPEPGSERAKQTLKAQFYFLERLYFILSFIKYLHRVLALLRSSKFKTSP